MVVNRWFLKVQPRHPKMRNHPWYPNFWEASSSISMQLRWATLAIRMISSSSHSYLIKKGKISWTSLKWCQATRNGWTISSRSSSSWIPSKRFGRLCRMRKNSLRTSRAKVKQGLVRSKSLAASREQAHGIHLQVEHQTSCLKQHYWINNKTRLPKDLKVRAHKPQVEKLKTVHQMIICLEETTK